MKVELFAPASIGNVSVGFDVLGAAIAPIDGSLLGDIVVVEADHNERLTLNIKGEFAAQLPSDPTKNIIYHCYLAFNQALQAQGITPVAVSLTLYKNMPIGSGLGSSACSIVAALDGLNQFYANPLTRDTLLGLMGQMEAVISGGLHYDNVAPCYLGGLQLMLELPECISQAVPCFDNWYWVVAYPGIEVSTAQARALLPAQYPRQTLIDHSRHLAAFIHACHSNQPQLAASMLKDVVAEPYRQTLLPNFVQTMATAKEFGMLASGISGSGPTIFAVTDNLASAQRFSAWLNAHYLQTAAGFVHICQLDKQGSRPLTNAL